MYTQCPECGTVFRVTAAVLRAASGQVRCGVCDANFDALHYLSDDADPATPSDATPASSTALAPRALAPDIELSAEILPAEPLAPEPAVRPPEGPAVPAPPPLDEQRTLADIAASLAQQAEARERPSAADAPSRDVDSIVRADAAAAEAIPDAALEFNAPAEDWDRVFVADEFAATITPLDVNLEPGGGHALDTATEPDFGPVFATAASDGEDPLARTDEYRTLDLDVGEPTPEPPAAVSVEAAEPAAPSPSAEPPEELEAAPPAPESPFTVAPSVPDPDVVAATVDAAIAAEGIPLSTLRVTPERERRRRRAAPLARAAGVVLLAGLLGAQLVDYFREPIAASAGLGPTVRSLYARLGRPIEPHWDVSGYDVKQWGAGTDAAPGGLRLRASIVNRSERPQPYPLLRVTLEDRFGGRVARREFSPHEYLPGRAAPAELLAPGARADADLSLADPGSQAVGFELDVCLERGGRLTCGGEQHLAEGG